MKILQVLRCAVAMLLPLSAAQLCSNEDRNWNFSNGTNGWIEEGKGVMGNYTSELLSEYTSAIMTEKGDNSTVLAVRNRKHHYSGPSQDLDKSCYKIGERLAVSVMIKLYSQKDNVTEIGGYNCAIEKHWGEDKGNDGVDTGVCPALTLRLVKKGKATKHIDIAHMVPPYKFGSYNTLYGEILITEEMLDADNMRIYFSQAEAKVNLYIEHVSIDTLLDKDRCTTLIDNGDGETGDAREWSQYGTRDGITDVINHDLSVGTHSIWSRYRAKWSEGVRVSIDSSCLEQGALYELKALVHMVYNNNAVGCDYTATSSSGEMCPIASVGAYNDGGFPQRRTVASATGPWVKEEFNMIRGSFSFFSNELKAKQLFIFFNMAPPNVDMILDEVILTKVRSATSFA